MFDLSHLNTLHVSAHTKNFLEINDHSDLTQINPSEPFLFLGLGANILFTHDFPGTVIKINLKGRKTVKETADYVDIEVAAGENWQDLVTWSVDQNLSGLENMAGIPSTIGGAVAGNIAAYGGNQQDVIQNVSVFDVVSKKGLVLTNSKCEFDYRTSLFKHQPNFLITNVVYRLSKNPQINASYFDSRVSLQSELAKIDNPTLKDVYDTILKIRNSKLPNPESIGTAGSFFKNPVVTKEKYQLLASNIPGLQWYPQEKLEYVSDQNLPEKVKIPAGKLLDVLGWKGKTVGRVSTSPNQALYVINLGGATGQEICEYAELMRQDIKTNFDINLEYEVKVV